MENFIFCVVPTFIKLLKAKKIQGLKIKIFIDKATQVIQGSHSIKEHYGHICHHLNLE